MNDAAEAARRRYIAEHETFEAAAKEMKKLLRKLFRNNGVPATVDARAKDIPSFVKKVGVKYATDPQPWDRVTDKVGARVIVGTRPDLKRAEDLLKNDSGLEVLTFEDKRVDAKPDQLIYPGTHINVVVPKTKLSDDSSLQCEIQIRSKAEDLWSVPSHKLLYKGALTAPPETQRRIWRLQALVELFDEEVARAMTEVEGLDSYASALLLKQLEAAYLTLVAKPGDDELSMSAMQVLAPLVPKERLADYSACLATFVEANHDKLVRVYKEYGYASEWAEEFGYWMFTQPESVMVFERITHDIAGLRQAVQHTELEAAVRPLFDAWGQPFDLD